MELNPHDLLRIKGIGDVITHAPMPHWAESSLAISPYVVVRRSRAPNGQVAVGVRGFERKERFAAFFPIESVMNRISPEQLAQEKGWRQHSSRIFQCLEPVSDLMEQYSVLWGPTGSVGFELATGRETVTSKSDIDMVIRFSEVFTPGAAREIVNTLMKLPVRIDVQLEMKEGAVSLLEYASCEGKALLFRTVDGPLLRHVHEQT
ncbi:MULTISPECIES: malonate decarboxylase holo-ACP synthase [Peribacillus]|uniref:Phosphoribosyl-dephospho-CoA transferase n=1 Tax=Peribacillus simplex TaxID=1478 RepID=A0A120GP37_9BACI|nr:malonate decarboxylase holo-ACP synthase [Peribacillus simplex]KWW17286.1 hypothetical protein AS888_22010 [Peribacillus simplex]